MFHDHLPFGCPPIKAIEPDEITVYCLVKHDSPSLEDFKSLKERKPDTTFNDPELDCQSCGLSVYTDAKGIELAKNVSRSLRKMKMARGVLTKKAGKIQNTPSKRTGNTHHTWWPLKEINPCEIFKVMSS
jgi:hypothetical protein